VSWALLFIAGLFEVGWAVGLKFTDGFTRTVPTVLVVASMSASVWLLSIALRSIPVGTGYAAWTGIGAVGTAIVGMFVFGESREILRILSILLIVAGVVGLKVLTPA
jgi:quaternary ammonium compound-resistance protein SugE